MTTDEIQASIARAEQKRRELVVAHSLAERPPNVTSILPRAAELYRKQIAEGLDGNLQAALKARVILRDLLGKFGLRQKRTGACGLNMPCGLQHSSGVPQVPGQMVAGACLRS